MMAYLEMPSYSTEDVEKYTPGGLHPVMINQLLGGGRYRVVHKLGSGGLATVWLARDLEYDSYKTTIGPLVSLKIQRADKSPEHAEESFEVVIPRKLANDKPELRPLLALPEHAFVELGPNGTHLCVTSELAGPSLRQVTSCIGRPKGSRRLRGDVARKVSAQVAQFIKGMHSAGFVHGDLTSNNILLQPKERISRWSDKHVYDVLGEPIAYGVARLDGQPPGPHAPAHLVENVGGKFFVDTDLLSEDAVVIDFGQSFEILNKPLDYQPATAANYRAPETRFEDAYTTATDVWSLGCLLFEIRGGEPLFESCLSTDDDMVQQIVQLCGKLPPAWWSKWAGRHDFYHESGEPFTAPHERESSIRARVYGIGIHDFKRKYREGGGVIETSGTRLHEDEVTLLSDLLEKMLRLRPEERITMDKVVQHPWFTYQSRLPLVGRTDPANTSAVAALI